MATQVLRKLSQGVLLRRGFLTGVLLIALVGGWVATPRAVYAQPTELRVLDSRGLTRLVVLVPGPVPLVVTLSREAPGVSASLEHVDGLSPEQKSVTISPSTLRFSRVPAGTWEITLHGAGPDVSIKSIEIK